MSSCAEHAGDPLSEVLDQVAAAELADRRASAMAAAPAAAPRDPRQAPSSTWTPHVHRRRGAERGPVTLAHLGRAYSNRCDLLEHLQETPPTLYEWSFDSEEHGELSTAILGSQEFRWVLSYDDNPVIRSLYENRADHAFRTVEYLYTAAGSSIRKSKSELLVSNYPDVPTDLSNDRPQSPRGNSEERAK